MIITIDYGAASWDISGQPEGESWDDQCSDASVAASVALGVGAIDVSASGYVGAFTDDDGCLIDAIYFD
jgi:hypothetical protein